MYTVNKVTKNICTTKYNENNNSNTFTTDATTTATPQEKIHKRMIPFLSSSLTSSRRVDIDMKHFTKAHHVLERNNNLGTMKSKQIKHIITNTCMLIMQCTEYIFKNMYVHSLTVYAGGNFKVKFGVILRLKS